MTPEIWTILGTGATLAAIGITGFTLLWRYITRVEQRSDARFAELKSDLKTDLDKLGTRAQSLETEVRTQNAELRERMAKLEGLLEGLREAITGKRAA